MTETRRFWFYIGRFSFVHVVAYFLIGFIFLIIQNALPESQRIALEFYKPYQSISITVLFNQIIKGIVIALLLYPFYSTLIKNGKGKIMLFSTLWGLALVGSVEPLPGSIEGFIYTITTLSEHFIVLIAKGIQVLLFFLIFHRINRFNALNNKDLTIEGENQRKLGGYIAKFTLLHVITYTLFGVIFYNLQDYESAFETVEYFKLFRPMDHPIVAMAMPIQIIRGSLLAVCLYPFYINIMEKKNGWLLLFLLIFGFTALVPGGMISELITAIRSPKLLTDFLVGIPEITFQMIAFSWLFFKWEKRKVNGTKSEVGSSRS